MPWSRLRARPGDTRSLRRHSTTDPTSLDHLGQQRPPQEADHLGYDRHDALKSPSPLRHSFEPSIDNQNPPSPNRPKSPGFQEQPPNRQRFSMLRFRHASDPQISKTARDQAQGSRPPMPAGRPSPNSFTYLSKFRNLTYTFHSASHNHYSPH